MSTSATTACSCAAKSRRCLVRTVDDCRVIQLPKVSARQGNLTAVAARETVPFDIARVYYLYDVPGGESRGGHAHLELQQLVVCVLGALEVVLDDGRRRKRVRL